LRATRAPRLKDFFMSFLNLGLEPELLRAVADKGYTEATPIQLQAIPAVLAGGDLLAAAQTGTGKTAGFVLPLLQMLGTSERRGPRVLILVPTRELAAQVADSVKAYGAHKKLRVSLIYGGVGENPQIDALRSGMDVLIATPGRLLDLLERGFGTLAGVKHFVLDEADRMLDMGFIRDIRRIIKLLPRQRQNLLFSATFSDEIRILADGLLRSPTKIEIAARNQTAERVDQLAFRIPKEQKRHLLTHFFQHGAADEGAWTQALVFTRTKHGANRLTDQLERAGIRAAAIHGNKSQSARLRALADFKANKITALVATEVASRGLDIRELPVVVNYEMPNVPEDYVHRIGRTARAGRSGLAVSLVAPDETGLMRDIEKTTRQTLQFQPLPGFAQAVDILPARSDATPQANNGAPRRGSPGKSNGGDYSHGNRRSQGGNQPRRHGGAPRRHGHGSARFEGRQ
jgi:ATP-dependent RNA helicase RhlE